MIFLIFWIFFQKMTLPTYAKKLLHTIASNFSVRSVYTEGPDGLRILEWIWKLFSNPYGFPKSIQFQLPYDLYGLYHLNLNVNINIIHTRKIKK